MSWIKESKEEIEALTVQELHDGTYMDDMSVIVTCKYCNKKIPIFSVACCEERKAEEKPIDDRIAQIAKIARDRYLNKMANPLNIKNVNTVNHE